MTNYQNDIKYGKKGESLVIKYFKYNNISFLDARYTTEYRIDDIDFLFIEKNGSGADIVKSCDVKHSYKNNNILIFELNHNHNPKYGSIVEGWTKKSKADYFYFTSDSELIILKNDHRFKIWWEGCSADYDVHLNLPTEKYGYISNQSSYIKIPIDDIKKYIVKHLYTKKRQ